MITLERWNELSKLSRYDPLCLSEQHYKQMISFAHTRIDSDPSCWEKRIEEYQQNIVALKANANLPPAKKTAAHDALEKELTKKLEALRSNPPPTTAAAPKSKKRPRSKLDRNKMMENMGFPETEDGFRDALDFLVSEINARGGLKASKEMRDRWRDALPSRVMRIMEEDNVSFSRACLIVDKEDGKKNATENKLRRTMVKEKITVHVSIPARIEDGVEVIPASDFDVEQDKFPELVKLLSK